MSDKLGFTFYPKDWWTSESYFELTPIQRYYYLECLFIMYSNDGFMKTQKTQFENRIRTQVLQSDWDLVIDKFILDDGQFTHPSVNKRLRKAVANRENGKKGGRPPKPKKPNLKTQNNPPLESESESEREEENKIEIKINNKDFVDVVLMSNEWLEVTAMQNKFSIDRLKEFIKEFERHLIISQEQKESLKDFKEHFSNWLKKQPKEVVKKNNGMVY